MHVLFLIFALSMYGAAATEQAGPSAVERWQQQMNLGQQYQDSGHYLEAQEHFQSALRAAGGLSPNDPRNFVTRVALGLVTEAVGQYTEAEQWDNSAIRLGQEIYGAGHAELAVPFTNLAVLYRDQGEYGRAEDYCRRALALIRGKGAPKGLAHVLGTLGGILYHRGKLAEAESSLQESIQIAEGLQSSEIVAGDLSNLAAVYAEKGRRAEALSTLQRAYTAYESTGGSNHPNLFFVLADMAALQAASGDYEKAVRSVESGIRIAENDGAGNTMLVGNALTAEAGWLHKLKRDSEAKRVRAKAKLVTKTAARNSYSQYTVDARQVARSAAPPSE
ncbi:MAG TPA: tetratricopeptide repeat protein [Bryobacteraceae bacterium]|nr:tetratricopeptide repeat protein [Bryobacteraceae bacterium]